MASEVFSVFNDAVSGINRLLGTSAKEKFAFSCFFGLTFAVINAQNRMDFVDKFIAGLIYFSWAVFILPTLKSKLSVQLFWDVGVIFLTLFAADIMYFGVFFHFKKAWFTNTTHKFVEYQSLIFFMNVVRISVIIFCLVTSSSAFMKNNFKSLPFQGRKKEEPTPHMMKLRSSSKDD